MSLPAALEMMNKKKFVFCCKSEQRFAPTACDRGIFHSINGVFRKLQWSVIYRNYALKTGSK
jgi:hypothetical protein